MRVKPAPGRLVKATERLEEVESLVVASAEEGLIPLAFVLLCLDAGLRLGEALGLRWQSIEWGDDRDPNRALRIEEARPRGGEQQHAHRVRRAERLRL